MAIEKKRLLKRISNFDFFKRTLLIEFLASNTRANINDELPQLLCLPHDYIGRHIAVDGLYEFNLLDSIFSTLLASRKEEFSKTTVLDVGANIGNHTCYFASRFDHVISFEPNDTVLPILEANIKINEIDNISVQKVGLSDNDDELTLVENDDGNLGSATFTESMALDILNYKKLPVRNGDRLLAKNFPDCTISLVKMDIEGHELPALKGLRSTLIDHQPIVLFECHNMPGLQEEGQDIIDYLKSLSYRHFYSIEPPYSAVSNRLARIFLRLIRGSSFYAAKMDKLDHRFYPLVVASVRCLD